MIEHHFGGGVYAKGMHLPANYVIGKHTHAFDHLSILAHGSVEFMVDGEVTVVDAPACLTIKANKEHCVRALTDVLWYCIHATDCTDADKIDEILLER
jgi:quercetin dioxygenase-like cupin family protein